MNLSMELSMEHNPRPNVCHKSCSAEAMHGNNRRKETNLLGSEWTTSITRQEKKMRRAPIFERRREALLPTGRRCYRLVSGIWRIWPALFILWTEWRWMTRHRRPPPGPAGRARVCTTTALRKHLPTHHFARSHWLTCVFISWTKCGKCSADGLAHLRVTEWVLCYIHETGLSCLPRLGFRRLR